MDDLPSALRRAVPDPAGPDMAAVRRRGKALSRSRRAIAAAGCAAVAAVGVAAAAAVPAGGRDTVVAGPSQATPSPAPMQGYTPPAAGFRFDEPLVAGEAASFRVVILGERDVVVHEIDFGDGTKQVTRHLCASTAGGAAGKPAPVPEQIHKVEHTWDEPGRYKLTARYGPACAEPGSTVTQVVQVPKA
jgi:hypothetical protein